MIFKPLLLLPKTQSIWFLQNSIKTMLTSSTKLFVHCYWLKRKGSCWPSHISNYVYICLYCKNVQFSITAAKGRHFFQTLAAQMDDIWCLVALQLKAVQIKHSWTEYRESSAPFFGTNHLYDFTCKCFLPVPEAEVESHNWCTAVKEPCVKRCLCKRYCMM